VPGLFASRRSGAAQHLANALVILGSLLGLGGVIACLADGSADLDLPSLLPFGRLSLRIDALSAVFLLPIFLLPALGSVYGLGYWKQSEHPENGRKLRFFYGLLAGAMATVVMAHDAVLFLFAWEAMALSAFFLVCTEDHERAARRAAWVYFVATHVGTLCLFALFSLMCHATGSFALDPIAAAQLEPEAAKAMFLLALCGFGLKCGIMPLHVWLPGAHANAPSHVSAVLSGVMLKVGVYGFVRVTGLLPDPHAWWGGTLLALGVVSGVVGMAFALEQRDLKRALAYSSIENVGIIFIGIGLAMIGRSSGHPEWIALGLGGALLHVWNHSLFKPLLFFCAGSVVHATGTRDIEKLGGLSKRMPRTAALFVIGAVAISGLPPLNGFVSEWLVYQGLFGTIGQGTIGHDPMGQSTGAPYVWAAFAAPLLALIGALAVAGFVRLVGTVFLGQPRTDATQRAHDPPGTMTAPMALLAAACVGVSLAAPAIVPLLDRVVREWNATGGQPTASLAELVPLGSLVALAATLIPLVALGLFVFRLWIRRRSIASMNATGGATAGTWGCAYPRPTARMQYTGSSFSQALVWMFSFTLWPRQRGPRIVGPFPASSAFRQGAPDTILDRLLLPAFRRSARRMTWFRPLQQGSVQIYLLYVPAIVLILLLIA
jgi:hydrogenase-4 component B